MKSRICSALLATFAAGVVLLVWDIAILPPHQHAAADDEVNPTSPKRGDHPSSVGEARARARLLYEMIHGALQVMHRDFFREDEALKIPSSSLDDVFLELSRSQGVKVRWLSVNTDAMNVDHAPQDDFEKRAAKSLAAGREEFDAVEGDAFRYAGAIRLSSQCLKCHVPFRRSNADRTAGVVITMPLKKESPHSK